MDIKKFVSLVILSICIKSDAMDPGYESHIYARPAAQIIYLYPSPYSKRLQSTDHQPIPTSISELIPQPKKVRLEDQRELADALYGSIPRESSSPAFLPSFDLRSESKSEKSPQQSRRSRESSPRIVRVPQQRFKTKTMAEEKRTFNKNQILYGERKFSLKDMRELKIKYLCNFEDCNECFTVITALIRHRFSHFHKPAPHELQYLAENLEQIDDWLVPADCLGKFLAHRLYTLALTPIPRRVLDSVDVHCNIPEKISHHFGKMLVQNNQDSAPIYHQVEALDECDLSDKVKFLCNFEGCNFFSTLIASILYHRFCHFGKSMINTSNYMADNLTQMENWMVPKIELIGFLADKINRAVLSPIPFKPIWSVELHSLLPAAIISYMDCLRPLASPLPSAPLPPLSNPSQNVISKGDASKEKVSLPEDFLTIAPINLEPLNEPGDFETLLDKLLCNDSKDGFASSQ